MGFRPQKKIRLPGILAYFLTRNPNFWVPSFKNFAKMPRNRLFFTSEKFFEIFFFDVVSKNPISSNFIGIFEKNYRAYKKARQKIRRYGQKSFFDFHNFTCFYEGFSRWLQKNFFFQKKIFSKKSIFEPVLLNFSKRGPENSDSSSKNSPVQLVVLWFSPA